MWEDGSSAKKAIIFHMAISMVIERSSVAAPGDSSPSDSTVVMSSACEVAEQDYQ